MIRTIDHTIAKIDKQISKHQRTIETVQKRLPKLATQKENLLKMKEKYPNGKFQHGAIYLDTIDWNNIAGISIERQWNRGGTTIYAVKFSLNKKESDGVKVYMLPADGKIAELQYSNKTLKILDYKGIIPETCPRRRVLIKQIKRTLIKMVRDRKLNVSDDSFDKEGFSKLMVLT